MKKTQELTLKIEDLEERIAPHALVAPELVGGTDQHVGHFSTHEELPAGLETAREVSPALRG